MNDFVLSCCSTADLTAEHFAAREMCIRDSDGTELYRYSYGGRTLQSAAISAGKNAVLLFGDGVHGALTQLTLSLIHILSLTSAAAGRRLLYWLSAGRPEAVWHKDTK